MDILGKMFGGEGRVKMIRMFLLNPGELYDVEAISKRTKVKPRDVKKELSTLKAIGLVRSQKSKDGKKRVELWSLDERFPYLSHVRTLLVSTILYKEEDIARRLGKAGRIKLVVLAGVFLQDWDDRADLLVVGERIKEPALRAVIQRLESEIGKELRYAALETADFQYRMSVSDKLIRDVFDFPHRIVVDRLGIGHFFSRPAIHTKEA